ncbi:MAG: hypothetical protein HQL96_13285 [Magnetococcales bacterium]|nr:hypothetical protein [Magnetococcales bacterium]
MSDSPSPGKADVVRLLLESEGRAMLCLDATRSGVMVPRRFAKDIELRLILNRNMPQPIDIGVEAIESELRFGGIPHYCVIPYDAVWGVFNPDTRHGMFWSESMPEEVRARYGLAEVDVSLPVPPVSSPAPDPVEEPPPVSPRARVGLQVIEGGGSEETAPPRKRPPPHLRLVT